MSPTLIRSNCSQEYVAERVISGGPVEMRFTLATKGTELKREVT